MGVIPAKDNDNDPHKPAIALRHPKQAGAHCSPSSLGDRLSSCGRKGGSRGPSARRGYSLQGGGIRRYGMDGKAFGSGWLLLLARMDDDTDASPSESSPTAVPACRHALWIRSGRPCIPDRGRRAPADPSGRRLPERENEGEGPVLARSRDLRRDRGATATRRTRTTSSRVRRPG